MNEETKLERGYVICQTRREGSGNNLVSEPVALVTAFYILSGQQY